MSGIQAGIEKCHLPFNEHGPVDYINAISLYNSLKNLYIAD